MKIKNRMLYINPPFNVRPLACVCLWRVAVVIGRPGLMKCAGCLCECESFHGFPSHEGEFAQKSKNASYEREMPGVIL